MDQLPRGRSDGRSQDVSGHGPAAVDLERLADWIAADVVSSLTASRQAIVDAARHGEPGAGDVCAQLLVIIDRLRELERELRAVHGDGRSLGRIELLADAVAKECEDARALAARSTQLIERTPR